MMANDENWEAAVDWSGFDPVGGRAFYDFVKERCDTTLAFGIAELEKTKAEHETKLRRWEGLAKLFSRLEEDFAAMRSSQDFNTMMTDIDRKALLMFPAAKFITLERWLEWGEFLTKSLKTSSAVAPRMRTELADISRDLANAEALKRFLGSYVTACEKDYLLRRAPVRFRTKLFREVAREIAAVVTAGAQLNMTTAPEFVRTLKDEVETIKELARRTQKTCRLAKKTIERRGESFWHDFTEWDGLRRNA